VIRRNRTFSPMRSQGLNRRARYFGGGGGGLGGPGQRGRAGTSERNDEPEHEPRAMVSITSGNLVHMRRRPPGPGAAARRRPRKATAVRCGVCHWLYWWRDHDPATITRWPGG